MPHQLAVNRALDAIGASALLDHELPHDTPTGPFAPDAVYEIVRHETEEDLDIGTHAWVLIDMGHRRADRLQTLIETMNKTRSARALLIVTPDGIRTDELRAELASRLRRYGSNYPDRGLLHDHNIEICQLEDIRAREFPITFDPLHPAETWTPPPPPPPPPPPIEGHAGQPPAERGGRRRGRRRRSD